MNNTIPVRYTIDLTKDPLGSARAVICYGWDGCFPAQPSIVLRSVWSARKGQYMRSMGPPDWRAVALVTYGEKVDLAQVRAAIDAQIGAE